MESPNGSGGDPRPQGHPPEKRRLNRAPSPARPFLKDAHSRAAKPPAAVPKSPKLSKQQQQQQSPAHPNPNRGSRRHAAAAKEKPAAVKTHAKSAAARKPAKVIQHAGAKADATSSSPVLTKGRKGKLAPGGSGAPGGHASPIRVPTGAPAGRVSQTDSSSDLSDCPSEPLSDEQRLAAAASSDAESGSGSSDRDQQPGAENNPRRADASATSAAPAAPAARAGDASAAGGSMSQAQPAPGSRGDERKPEKPSASAQARLPGARSVTEEELLREIEDLRSENDYLKVRERIGGVVVSRVFLHKLQIHRDFFSVRFCFQLPPVRELVEQKSNPSLRTAQGSRRVLEPPRTCSRNQSIM